jgi:hypothetical protein
VPDATADPTSETIFSFDRLIGRALTTGAKLERLVNADLFVVSVARAETFRRAQEMPDAAGRMEHRHQRLGRNIILHKSGVL